MVKDLNQQNPPSPCHRDCTLSNSLINLCIFVGGKSYLQDLAQCLNQAWLTGFHESVDDWMNKKHRMWFREKTTKRVVIKKSHPQNYYCVCESLGILEHTKDNLYPIMLPKQ